MVVVLVYRGGCAVHGTVLLDKVCYGRVWCIGEGMQEGHALIAYSLQQVLIGKSPPPGATPKKILEKRA
jgi:hypothetical protein